MKMQGGQGVRVVSCKPTKGVAARQLWLLSVLGRQDLTNAVEKLYIGLLRILLESRNKRPRHGTSGRSIDGGISTVLSHVSPRLFWLSRKLTKFGHPCFLTT